MISGEKIFLQIIFCMFLCLTSCSDFTKDDKAFYERITKMNFPKNVKVIETFDNSEFYTTTSFKVDSITLLNFVKEYKFDTMKKYYPSRFLGEHCLKKDLPNFNNLKNLLYTSGTKGKNSWIYIADLKRNILWAEVTYPDFGGN